MVGYKRWRSWLLIPETHEPGIQRGYRQSMKGRGINKSEHQSKPHKSVRYYPLIPWGKEPR